MVRVLAVTDRSGAAVAHAARRSLPRARVMAKSDAFANRMSGMSEKAGLTHAGINKWVDEVAAMTRPDRVVVCNGSEAEKQTLVADSLASGELIALNQQKMPGCYLHRSAPHDVARTEHLTFVCTSRKDDAGPNN